MDKIQKTFQFAQQAGIPGVGRSYASDIVGLHFQHASQKTGGALGYQDAPFDYAINVLVLRDALGQVVLDFEYDDDPALGWPVGADENGGTLVIRER